MALGISPTVDYAFKRLFGDPNHARVLVHLLNAVFENQFIVHDVQILTPFLEKDFVDDKLAVLDLRVRDTTGRQYNLEMQTTITEALPSRLVYYLATMYSEQLTQGESYMRLAPAATFHRRAPWRSGPTSCSTRVRWTPKRSDGCFRTRHLPRREGFWK